MISVSDSPLRVALIEAAIEELAHHGLEAVSLRRVAAAIGRSTTTVFQHFGGKSGLLEASLEHALAGDRAFHEDFAHALQGLVLDHDGLAATIALYIEQRATAPLAGLWSEILFKSAQVADVAPILRRWHEMRVAFWQDIAGESRRALAPLLSAYVAMEENYARVLHTDLGYRLALRETISRLIDAAFTRAAPASTPDADPAVRWLEAQPAPPAPTRTGDAALGDRLLDLAAREIFQHGVMALTHRRLTALAGVSASMIIYHFGDMASFTNAAIWHALMQGLPSYLGPDRLPHAPRQSMAEWTASLEQTVSRSTAGPGYYIAYARIVGQTCLLARRDQSLVPLVRYLRAIEGMGVHGASQHSWPESLRMGRANGCGFAIWIKGFAILNESLGSDGNESAVLRDAARVLVAAPEAHRTSVT